MTIWAMRHAPVDGADYVPVVARLLAAGADVTALGVARSGVAAVDELLRKHGAGG